MGQRPEYVNIEGSNPSVETWAEACAISQKWADGARLAAVKRRKLRGVLVWLLLLTIEITTAVVLAFIVFDIQL